MRSTRLLVVVALACIARAGWPQGPVGPEFRVNTYTTSWQRGPDVSVDATGAFVVVWTSQQEGAKGVFGQRFDSSGVPLGPEFLVSAYTTQSFLQRNLPRVASDPSGNFVVVWESVGFDGSGLGVVGQRYSSSGAPLGSKFVVNTDTTGYQYGGDVASDGSGNFVVVWQSPEAGNLHIMGQRFAASGVPAGTEFRVGMNFAGQSQQAVAADEAGDFIVVWTNQSTIFGRRYASSGVPLDVVFKVSENTIFQKSTPAVASDASGNFIVVWENFTSDGPFEIYGRRFSDSGAPLGSEFVVGPGFFGPAVASDAAGNSVVVWLGAGIVGQRYASSGAPLGTQFRVNTTPGSKYLPVVAADPAGDFVVVWDSDLQDGSDLGVFGQRFRPIVPVELMHLRVE